MFKIIAWNRESGTTSITTWIDKENYLLLLQACDIIRSDVLKPENKANNICISQEIFFKLGHAVKASSDATFKLNFFQLCDAMNDYAGLDEKTLEEMVFEEVNPRNELMEDSPNKRFRRYGVNQRQKTPSKPLFKSLEEL